jgi:UDP-sulfoquinovose synthase
MRVIVLGGDGYLGWPTAMHMARRGHEVLAVDNYLRRTLALQTSSEALVANPNLVDRARIFQEAGGPAVRVEIGDGRDFAFLERLFREFQPEAAIHYAEQPSGPYSMMGYDQARLTLDNNLQATFNVVWAAIRQAPRCQIVKLGTMGEYGTPNIDIEEGWIEIDHKGRKDRFLFPRQAGTLYHTTKVLDTDMLWFYVRLYGLAVTDLMQGPVYGLSTPEADLDERLMPNFHYDDIFGTVVNRFLVQAVARVPLTVYGKGGQTRGYLNLNDTLQCVSLAVEKPASPGELRVLNQFTEPFSVNEIAERVRTVGNRMGLDVRVESIPNPRKEKEEHYYNPVHRGLLELGLQPHYMTEEVVGDLLERVRRYRDRIDVRKIMPRVRWS